MYKIITKKIKRFVHYLNHVDITLFFGVSYELTLGKKHITNTCPINSTGNVFMLPFFNF